MTKLILGGSAAVVLAIVVLAAGWYFLVREDAELATDPPNIPASVSGLDESTTPSPTDATDAPATEVPAGTEPVTYTIVPDLSEAAYFVDEELASVGLPSTAKGSTNAIAGTIALSADGSALDAAGSSLFTVDLTTLQSNEDRRDNRVQQSLETGSFPTATFTISSIEGYDSAIAVGEQQNLTMTGTLDLHGVQKAIHWTVEALQEGNAISALATVTFPFADFDITPPNIGGFVSVADDVTLQIQLVAQAT